MDKNKPGFPFITVLIAVVILGALSFVRWDEISGNYFKRFNLLADIVNGELNITAEEQLDPELSKAEDLIKDEEVKDKETRNQLIEKVEKGDNVAKKQLERVNLSSEVENPKEVINNRIDGNIIIEDYTTSNLGPRNLKNALASGRSARIAVIGDSYIEGDILTADIRRLLQDTYGGSGVGYMPASSNLTGFRQTVRQTCSGWTAHEIRDKGVKDSMKSLSGQYFTAGSGAKSTYKGTSAYPHLSSWDKTTVLAIAPNGGEITVGSETKTLEPSSEVQSLVLNGNVSSVEVKASQGIEVLGVYLDGNSGILVDNMSLRGNSGITHRNISIELADQMSKFIDYDMIVIEYGINALSSKQKDYSGYKTLMKKTIGRLRQAYPRADILLLGIGDRGQKFGTEVKSVPTSSNMVDAQRDAAREMGILFWDTRAAMGGEGSSIEWRKKGLINPDYIHLNQKGGKALGELFVDALKKSLN